MCKIADFFGVVAFACFAIAAVLTAAMWVQIGNRALDGTYGSLIERLCLLGFCSMTAGLVCWITSGISPKVVRKDV